MVASLHRRSAPRKIIRDDGYQTNLGVTVMGEILEVASFVATPLGAILGGERRRSCFFLWAVGSRRLMSALRM